MSTSDQSAGLVPPGYEERLHSILNLAWRIFQAQFTGGRHLIQTEAPFQLHFANIIATVGGLYCINQHDLFSVDLETRCDHIKGKNKYLDITCGFVNADVRCALELKFKRKEQGGQTDNRVDAYRDIEALQLACETKYNFGRFYMITNDETYVHPRTSSRSDLTCALYDGFQASPGLLRIPRSRNGRDITLELKNAYTFKWTSDNSRNWYFLEVPVTTTNVRADLF